MIKYDRVDVNESNAVVQIQPLPTETNQPKRTALLKRSVFIQLFVLIATSLFFSTLGIFWGTTHCESQLKNIVDNTGMYPTPSNNASDGSTAHANATHKGAQQFLQQKEPSWLLRTTTSQSATTTSARVTTTTPIVSATTTMQTEPLATTTITTQATSSTSSFPTTMPKTTTTSSPTTPPVQPQAPPSFWDIPPSPNLEYERFRNALWDVRPREHNLAVCLTGESRRFFRKDADNYDAEALLQQVQNMIGTQDNPLGNAVIFVFVSAKRFRDVLSTDFTELERLNNAVANKLRSVLSVEFNQRIQIIVPPIHFLLSVFQPPGELGIQLNCGNDVSIRKASGYRQFQHVSACNSFIMQYEQRQREGFLFEWIMRVRIDFSMWGGGLIPPLSQLPRYDQENNPILWVANGDPAFIEYHADSMQLTAGWLFHSMFSEFPDKYLSRCFSRRVVFEYCKGIEHRQFVGENAIWPEAAQHCWVAINNASFRAILDVVPNWKFEKTSYPHGYNCDQVCETLELDFGEFAP
jgi:hypothetical protein